MASFQKRGKTWQYTISHTVNGKSKPIRKGAFRTKGEAQAAAAEVETELQRGFIPQLKPKPFDDYFEEWLKVFKSDISKNTMARYKNSLKTVREYFTGTPIQSINKRQYQAFLNEYARTRTKETTRKLNTHIRACVKDAIDEGLIRIDFTRGAALPGSVPSKRPEEKHLNYFESKRLMKTVCSQLSSMSQYLILLGLSSGCRFAELVGLTRKDFDFKNLTLSINKSWGYTNKMDGGFGTTKNEQSNRVIKMDEQTMTIFKKWFSQTPENMYGLIFYSPNSKYSVISNTAVNKTLKSILNKLNIGPISVHGLRHTHASVLLYKKVSIYYVSERLGHGDIETTLQHYAHIVKELRRQDEESTTKIIADLVV